MKKIFLYMSALCMFFTHANAQNVSPYWSLAGNSNAATASKFGTTNNVSLRFYTNNKQRMIINSAAGYVGIGNPSPVNILTVQSSGGTPAGSWLDGLDSPVFAGFGEVVSSEFLLAGATNSPKNRSVFQGRKSRGSLAAPKAVVTDDYITSFLASAYDGSTFQNPALINFLVDGTPTKGNVPTRISFVTGSNIGNRTERLKVGSTGNIDFNNGQVYLQQSTGFLGVGTTSPVSNLHVEASGTAVYGNSSGGGNGIYGKSTYLGVLGAGGTYGVFGTGSIYGVYGYSSGSYGVYASSGYVGVYGNATSYGLSGAGSYGVSGEGSYIGVFGTSTNGTATVGNCVNGTGGNFYSDNGYGLVAGTKRSDKNYAGVFNGNLFAYGAYLSSDKNLKNNIKDVKDAMSIISQLKPKTYQFQKDGKFAPMNLPSGQHFGLLAQELEEVLPNLVKEVTYEGPVAASVVDTLTPGKKPIIAVSATNEKITSKAVNYIELIPIIIKAMQEQQTTIDKQNEKIEALTLLVNQLSRNTNNPVQLTNATLGNASPNPAAKSTRISYLLPQKFYKAELLMYNVTGQKIRQTDLTDSGSIDIDTSTLGTGTYSYTLIVDGAFVDSKKMVITK